MLVNLFLGKLSTCCWANAVLASQKAQFMISLIKSTYNSYCCYYFGMFVIIETMLQYIRRGCVYKKLIGWGLRQKITFYYIFAVFHLDNNKWTKFLQGFGLTIKINIHFSY